MDSNLLRCAVESHMNRMIRAAQDLAACVFPLGDQEARGYELLQLVHCSQLVSPGFRLALPYTVMPNINEQTYRQGSQRRCLFRVSLLSASTSSETRVVQHRECDLECSVRRGQIVHTIRCYRIHQACSKKGAPFGRLLQPSSVHEARKVDHSPCRYCPSGFGCQDQEKYA